MAGKKAAKGDKKYPEFLDGAMLPSNGKRLKVKIGDNVGLYQRDNGETSLFVTVELPNGEERTLSVRCGGPDRITLQEQCGRNLLDWGGKTIELVAVQGRNGGTFVNVYNPNRK